MSLNIEISRKDCGRTKQGHLAQPGIEGWLRRLEKKGAVEGERGFSETRRTCAETETTREDGTLRRARETGTCRVHRNIHLDQNLGVEVGLEHVIEDPECQAKLFLCF